MQMHIAFATLCIALTYIQSFADLHLMRFLQCHSCRYQAQLKFEGRFKDLKDVQKIQVINDS